MNKRVLLIFLSLLILSLCACGKDDRPVPTEISEVTLRFYSTLAGTKDAEITSEVLSSYSAENSHITLYYSGVTTEEAYKLSLLDGGTYRQNAPDLVYAPISAIGDMLGEEYVSIEELRSYEPRFAADIADYALLYDSSGKPYGVSVRGEGRVLVMNTSLASDTRDIARIAEEISDSDVYIFADNALDSALFFEYMMTMSTNSEITPDTAQEHWFGGFELFSSLVKDGKFAMGEKTPFEIFSDDNAVFAVLSEEEASRLKGENYRCAAFFGGFTEGFFVSRSALSSPLKRQAVLSLAEKLIAEKDRYAEGLIPTDGTGVFFSLDSAYPLTPCEEKYGEGCWDETLSALIKGENAKSVLDSLMNKEVSDSDA